MSVHQRNTLIPNILNAYLHLLGSIPFEAVTMARLAAEVGISLADLRAEVDGELTLFEAFAALVDRGVLERAGVPQPDRAPEHRLLDVLMISIGVLEPYKSVVRALKTTAKSDPALGAVFSSISAREQSWMLVAAGIEVRGAGARGMAEALVHVFSAAVGAWLLEEDATLPHTRETLRQHLELVFAERS